MDGVAPKKRSDKTAESSSGQRKRRAYKSIPVACNECRRRKIACDGIKPDCGHCQSRGRNCAYEFNVHSDETRQAAQSRAREDATQQLAKIAQVLKKISTISEFELLQWLKLVLASPKPLEALAGIYNPPSDGTLSPRYASPFDVPSPSLDREYELARLHPAAYPCALRMLQEIFCSGFPSMTDDYIDSHKFGDSAQSLTEGDGHLPDDKAELTNRLSGLSIAGWTKVQLSDELAIDLITDFLTTEHRILALFDTDLFIADVLARRTRFCSELLVAGILFATCQTRAGSSARFRELRTQLLGEIRRVWPAAREADGAITLSTAQLLLCYCVAGGEYDLADDLQRSGEEMWHHLNRLGQDPAQFELYRPPLPPVEVEGMAHVAWSTFSFTMLFNRSYGKPPPDEQPSMQLPRREHQEQARRRYEVIDDSFEELAGLRAIEHEIQRTYHAYRAYAKPISDHVPLHFVSRKYVELLAWVDELDELHQRREEAPYHVLVLHMCYHIALMDLFRPFVLRASPEDFIAPAGKTSKYLFIASLDQLKALVIRLRFRQPVAKQAVLWHSALVQIVSYTLRAGYTATDRLFYFRLCIEAYFDMLSAFPPAFDIIKVIICIGMHEKIVDMAEVRDIWKRLQTHDRLRIDTTRAAHLADLNMSMSDGMSPFAEVATGRLDQRMLQEMT